MAEFGDAGHTACFLTWLKQNDPGVADLSDFAAAHMIELYPEIYRYGPHYHTWMIAIHNLRLKLSTPEYFALIVEMAALIDEFDETYSKGDILSEDGLSEFDIHPEREYRFARFGDKLGYAEEYRELSQNVAAKDQWEKLYTASLNDPTVRYCAYTWALDVYSLMHLFQDVIGGIELFKPVQEHLLALQVKWGLLETPVKASGS